MALKADSTKLNDYATKADELALALKRALALEEFPPHEANEMVVQQTIDLCRSTLVRGILAVGNFETPEEVVAKYIVETRKEKTENQILHFKQQNARGRFLSNRGNNYRGYSRNRNYQNQANYNPNFNQNFNQKIVDFVAVDVAVVLVAAKTIVFWWWKTNKPHRRGLKIYKPIRRKIRKTK